LVESIPLEGHYETGALDGGLMLGALVFLLFPAISAEAGVIGLFLFLACFVAGVMMLGGFFGEPAEVVRMRERAFVEGKQNRQQPVNVATREFRYKTGWFAYSVLVILFTGFLLAGLLFLAVAVINPSVRVVLVFMGLMFFALGGAGLLYVYCTSQLVIRTDSWGLRAVTLSRRAAIPQLLGGHNWPVAKRFPRSALTANQAVVQKQGNDHEKFCCIAKQFTR
jgi:hypothetical protein